MASTPAHGFSLRIAALIMLTLLAGCATLPENLHDLRNKRAVPMDRLLDHLTRQQVVLVGEAHDSELDHNVQLEVIRQLHESGQPLSIGLEAFPRDHQPALDAWVAGKIDLHQIRDSYYAGWTVPFYYYEPIFDYARRNNIPLQGLNLTPQQIQTRMHQDLGRDAPEDLERLKFTPCVQNPGYSRRMQAYWDRLGHRLDFERLCNTRRYKEAFMALHISERVKRTGETMVVLTGSLHAARDALPMQLDRHGIDRQVILLPNTLIHLTDEELDLEQADLSW